jgi:hypothetical protein
MTGKIMPLRDRDTSTVQATADIFLSSPRTPTSVPAAATPACWTPCWPGSAVARHAISACADVGWSLNKTLAIQTRTFCAGLKGGRSLILFPCHSLGG